MKDFYTIEQVMTDNGFSEPVQVVTPLETILNNGKFTATETKIITNLKTAITDSRSNQYAIMYYSSIVSENSDLLQKLGYSKKDFGKFMYDKFQFEKSKASRYAKIGKYFVTVEDGKICSKFSSLLPDGEDLTPSQLQEMLVSDKLIDAKFPLVDFWSGVLKMTPTGKLTVKTLRDFRNLLDNVVKQLPTNTDFSKINSPQALELKKQELDEIKKQLQAKVQVTAPAPTPAPTPEPTSATVIELPNPITGEVTPAPTPEPIQPEFLPPTLSEIVELLKVHKDEIKAMSKNDKKKLFGDLYDIIVK